MAAPVMSNDSIPLPEEVEHLGVPVVGAQWPAMMEDDGLRVLGAPVLVEDRHAVIRGNRAHLSLLTPSAFTRLSVRPDALSCMTLLLRTGARYRTIGTPRLVLWPADERSGAKSRALLEGLAPVPSDQTLRVPADTGQPRERLVLAP